MGRTTPESVARQVRWLAADEVESWRAVASTMLKLRAAMECQLERDSELSFIEYHALARLSEEPDWTLRMSTLAILTDASLSRLSHLVKRLESWGFVRREPDPANGRYTNAILTDEGFAKLEAAAPGHVECVRELVIDELTPGELTTLRKLSGRISARVEASPWRRQFT